MIAATDQQTGGWGLSLSPSGGEMPDSLFLRFSKLLRDESGIALAPHKKTMLAARLGKRLRSLGIGSFAEYFEYLCDVRASRDELLHFIDSVSTNKTEFYRENQHFDFLGARALPELAVTAARSGGVNLWSAGCSSGEEAYSAAIEADDYLAGRGVPYRVLGTDICTRVLEKAFLAIYPDRDLAAVPQRHMRRYFMKGIVDERKGYHRIVPEIRRNVAFMRHNLVRDDYSSLPAMDVIFCRNVAIYFERETQVGIYRRLCDKLQPGGYLFIGHSETLAGVEAGLERVGPTTYRKRARGGMS